MQRWLSGLRRTIGNRVTVNPVRRFKSSSLRQNRILWLIRKIRFVFFILKSFVRVAKQKCKTFSPKNFKWLKFDILVVKRLKKSANGDIIYMMTFLVKINLKG